MDIIGKLVERAFQWYQHLWNRTINKDRRATFDRSLAYGGRFCVKLSTFISRKLFDLETWNLVWDIFLPNPTNMPDFSKIRDGQAKWGCELTWNGPIVMWHISRDMIPYYCTFISKCLLQHGCPTKCYKNFLAMSSYVGMNLMIAKKHFIEYWGQTPVSIFVH